MKKIIVLGTDTNVGKTYFSGLLMRHLLSNPFTQSEICFIKPFQTGVGFNMLGSEAQLSPAKRHDLETDNRKTLRRSEHWADMLEMNDVQTDLERRGRDRRKGDCNKVSQLSMLSPQHTYSFSNYSNPFSPHLAASVEEKPLLLSDIIDKTNECFKRYDFAVIEGSGGVVVPLAVGDLVQTEKTFPLKDRNSMPCESPWAEGKVHIITFVDYLRTLGDDAIVILVARLGLGTLNHTLLTLSFLFQLGIKTFSVQLNRNFRHINEEVNKDNLKTLKDVLSEKGVGVYEFHSNLDSNFQQSINAKIGIS